MCDINKKKQNEENITHVIPNPRSVQLEELLALLKILVECQNESLNIISDSQYTVQAAHVFTFSRIKDSLNPDASTMQ